jgi:ABC-type nitrate/sulfonate/bicarbonate transport system permease component
MNSSATSKRSHLIFVLIYFILWVILFEFILPVNNILPKPLIVIQSFGDLWKDYNLPFGFLNTVASVYLSILIAYLAVHYLSHIFVGRKNIIIDFIHSLNWFSTFLPGILIGLLLIYWFPGSVYIEFVFAFGTAFLSLVIFFQKSIENLKPEYIDAARSLGITENMIKRKIIWKALQPEIFNHINELHLYIWSLIIAFEFIKGNTGLGNIFRLALLYRDLSALFSVFIIVGIMIFLGKMIIKYLHKKFAFWSL